jgi:3-hydroxyisobutyrate dehydrogenase-like beta-hydroxyacid dehydrogenase
VFHVGPAGSGQVIKLVNNLMTATNLVAIAEGLVLGAREGLDIGKMYEVIRVSSGGSRRLDDSVPRIIAGNQRLGHGNLDLLAKDLAAALELANGHNLPLPVTSQSRQMYQIAQAAGLGASDIEAIIRLYQDWAAANAPSSTERPNP